MCGRVDDAKCCKFERSSRYRASLRLAHGGPHNLERASLQLARNPPLTRALTSGSRLSSLRDVGAPRMTRYVPARHYLSFGLTALALAGFSGWLGVEWAPAFIPAVLFLFSAALLLILAFRPAIEIHEEYLAIGKRRVLWIDIRRLDRTGWISPLIVRMAMFDDSR